MANRIVQAVYDLRDQITGKLRTISEGLRSNREESDKTTAAVERNNKRASESFKKSGDALGFLRENLVAISAAAGAAVAAIKAIDFGIEGFKGAAEIEQSLARVKAIAETTGEDFARLREQIDQAAIAANVSTEQAAAAAAELAQQGQTAADIFETLTPTLLLAKAANIELAEAAGAVDDALDLFGKNAGDAALMVDQLVQASQGSKDGLSGIATAMRTLAPDARALGLDFEQLVGMLGLFGQNGIDAGKAARGLRTIFQELQDPSSKFASELSKLGDASGDFGSAIETIRNAGARGEQALLALDGASRSMVQFLLQQAPGALAAFTASLADAGGAATRTAKVLDTTLKGAFTSFTNAIDRLGEGLLESSLEPFRVELEKLAGQLTEFSNSEAFDRLKQTLATLFTEGTEAFDNFIQSIEWNKLVDGAQDAFSKTSQSIRGFKDDLSTVAEALNKIGATIGLVYRSIAVVFDTAKLGISKLVETKFAELAALSAQIDGMTGSTSNLTIALESVRDAAKAAADEGMANLEEDTGKVNENLRSLGGVAEEAAPTVERLGQGLEQVGTAAAAAGSGAAAAAPGFDALTQGVDNVALSLGILPELFTQETAAVSAATDAHAAHTQEILEARKAVEDARASLEALSTSGERNSVAFQQASKALQLAQAELDRLTGKAKDAAQAQRALDDAFSGLRITSQAKLQEAAAAATRHFETIRAAFASGQASIEDVRRAFEAYARDQRAAVADSDAWARAQVEAQLAVTASTIGLADSFKQAGDAGKEAGDKTAESFGRLREKVEETKDAVEDLAEENRGVADSHDEAAASARGYTAAAGDILLLSGEQKKAFKTLREELARYGTLQNVSLSTAQDLLLQIGHLIGSQAQVLQDRIRELQQAAEQAQQTANRMAEEAASVQDEIDQLAGNEGDIEQRRHERRLADLRAEAEATGTLNTAAYRQLVDLENELHRLKMKNLREQGQASGGSGGGSLGGGSPRPTPNADVPAASGDGRRPLGAPVTFSPNIILLTGNAQAREDLARWLRPEFERIARNSR